MGNADATDPRRWKLRNVWLPIQMSYTPGPRRLYPEKSTPIQQTRNLLEFKDIPGKYFFEFARIGTWRLL